MSRIVRPAGAVSAALFSLVVLATPASAVSLVVDGVDGTYTQLEPRSPGVYGVELRGGRPAAQDWEIGVGNWTSNSGTFNQGEFNWAASAGSYDFQLFWNTGGVSIKIGDVFVPDFGAGKAAPLIGNTLRIDLKGLSSLTINQVGPQVFNQSFSSPSSLLFYSSDAWGGVGFTVTGTLDIENGGGSRNGISFRVGEFTPNPAVPEPASWALLIAGFGFVGAAIRRRRAAVATA